MMVCVCEYIRRTSPWVLKVLLKCPSDKVKSGKILACTNSSLLKIMHFISRAKHFVSEFTFVK